MLTVCLILAAADAPPAVTLPLARTTLLRDAGCWLRWEGDAKALNGVVAVGVPRHVDLGTLSVERQEGESWRTSDFSIGPNGAAGPTDSKNADGGVPLRITTPSEASAVRLRVEAFSTAAQWRPAYHLELNGKASRVTLRAVIASGQALENSAAIECAAAAALARGDADQPWSDPTIYSLSAKQISRGTSSLVVFSQPVRAEGFVLVELGGMAGEPGVQPSRDRIVSMLRIVNKTAKAWPPGDLLVTRDGRLIARLAMPHLDAGRDVELSCGRAVGVAVAREEVELERKTATIRRETDAPDSVQTAGSVTVSNGNGSAVDFRVTKAVAGDANAASDDAKIVRAVNRLGGELPLNEIRWTFNLGPGQSKRLTFGTTIRIPPPAEPKDNRP